MRVKTNATYYLVKGCRTSYFIRRILVLVAKVQIWVLFLKWGSSFSGAKYTSLGVILPPKCFSEMVPWCTK